MYRRIIFRVLAGLTATAVLALSALALVVSHDSPCPPTPPIAEGSEGFVAIMQRCYGDPDALTLETLPMPEVAADQVLVRVHAASVNPLEKHHLYGKPYLLRLVNGFNAPQSPRTGADLAGVVEAIGADVTRFKPGDDVFGVGDGASGGIGTYAVQLAKAMGATVTGVCSGRNVEMVRALGADHVIDYTQEDYTEGDTRYDAIIDLVGNHSLSAMLEVTEPDGVLVLVGSMQMNPWWGPLARPLHAMLRSLFVAQRMESLLASINAEDLTELGRYAEAGQLTSIIDRRFPLAEVADAIRYLEQGRTRGKVVITVVP